MMWKAQSEPSHLKKAPGSGRRGARLPRPATPHTSRPREVDMSPLFPTTNTSAEKRRCAGDEAPASPSPLPACSAGSTQSP